MKSNITKWVFVIIVPCVLYVCYLMISTRNHERTERAKVERQIKEAMSRKINGLIHDGYLWDMRDVASSNWTPISNGCKVRSMLITQNDTLTAVISRPPNTKYAKIIFTFYAPDLTLCGSVEDTLSSGDLISAINISILATENKPHQYVKFEVIE